MQSILDVQLSGSIKMIHVGTLHRTLILLCLQSSAASSILRSDTPGRVNTPLFPTFSDIEPAQTINLLHQSDR